jgi:hypothetical protein
MLFKEIRAVYSEKHTKKNSSAHTSSYTMGTGGPFLEDKARPGRDADHSHLVPRSRMSGSIQPLPPSAFMESSGTDLLYLSVSYDSKSKQ